VVSSVICLVLAGQPARPCWCRRWAATQIIERAKELSQRDPAEYFEAGLNTILDGLRASRRR